MSFSQNGNQSVGESVARSARGAAIVSVFLFLCGCDGDLMDQFERFAIPRPAGERMVIPKDDYPTERVLTNQSGAQIKAKIWERTATHVVFDRVADNKRFSYPIALLSQADQDFLYGLPIPQSTGAKPVAARVKDRNDEIAKLNKEINRLYTQLEDPTIGYASPKGRGIRREIQRLESEVVKLRLQIDEIRNP
ncbi:MAG: hypothetical protein KDM91_04295 [Verrucomicrobiae bacterium]|nr:hypothetical protein [Verrucomicrobiae bacterium]MCP5541317.1 hypothetical protein [Akkermansiaceae bacterium]